jgi:hypothetical protein
MAAAFDALSDAIDVDIPNSLVDAKGDLLTATAADTPARLAVGSDGALLVPDTAASTGLKWTTARYFEGTGSPEAVVTAPVGSQYVDTAATTGAIRWIKATGSGNTGWVVEYGYTGLRVLTPINSWVVNSSREVTISREGNTCYINGYVGFGSADEVVEIPSGFRTSSLASRYAVGTWNRSTSVTNAAWINDSNELNLEGASGLTAVRFAVTWRTDEAWPTVLPGSPA